MSMPTRTNRASTLLATIALLHTASAAINPAVRRAFHSTPLPLQKQHNVLQRRTRLQRFPMRAVGGKQQPQTVGSQVAINTPKTNPYEEFIQSQFQQGSQKRREREPTQDVMMRAIDEQISLMNTNRELTPIKLSPEQLEHAYKVAEEITDEYAKTFSLGLRLMDEEKQKAVWAVYVWCRRTDELVDGSIATHITPTTLNRWEERLDQIFEGKAFDELDATLADTAAKFPVAKAGFKDMIEGMRMDLYKARYQNFEELKEYCYRVAGTVGLMTTPIMGIAKDSKLSSQEVLNAAVSLGIALQLTNILRDVGEDALTRNRIYLPLDELESFGLTEADIFAGTVDDRWREFMKFQIKRARHYFEIAKHGIGSLDPKVRWAVWAAGRVYGEILNSIEENDYDNLSRRAYVPRWKKFALLPVAFVQTLLM